MAPEFIQASDDQIKIFLRRALNVCSVARFEDLMDDAHALATAHYMKMDPTLTESLNIATGTVGEVASESHGPASVSYATSAPESTGDAWLGGSTYGREFKVMRNRVRGRGSAVRIGNRTPQRS